MESTETQTITVHIDRDTADRLLALAGITPEAVPGGHAFTLPGGTPRSEGGQFGRDYVWEIDDATRIAINEIAANDLAR